MPRRKFEPENWHPEIERWEKTISDLWYLHKQMMRYLKTQKEDEQKKIGWKFLRTQRQRMV